MSVFDEIEEILKNSVVPSVAPGARPAVLVLDDDASMRRALKLTLEGRYSLHMCATAEEVEAAIDEHTRCAVLDVVMAGKDGFWACERIQAADPLIPIVFHTAHQAVKDPIDIINEFHPFAFVTKDGDLGRLTRVLDRAVAHANISRSARTTRAKLAEVEDRLQAISARKPQPVR